MSFRDNYIKETVKLLKQQYNVSLTELIEAHTETVTVPATIFDNDLTPYEAICLFLFSVRNLTQRTIGEMLGRRTSSVKSAIENANEKKISIEENPHTVYRIPVSAFSDAILSPAETVVYHLSTEFGLRNIEIATILGKDARNTHQLLTRAKKKVKQ